MQTKQEKGKTVRFRIEAVSTEQRLIFARRLTPIDFTLGPASRLDSSRVEHFDIPRKINKDGSIDVDLFCFRLAELPDSNAFSVDSVVVFHE